MVYKKLEVLENTKLNDRYFILSFKDEELCRSPAPGQFCQLKHISQFSPILPRPFSVYKIENDTIFFLIKVVGTATGNFCKVNKGDKISVLGPLGNGFNIPKEKNVVLISGGIGYAPLPFLYNELKKRNNKIEWLHGGKDKDDIFSYDIINFTEDGSVGYKGLVTDGLREVLELNDIQAVFACGPNPMLEKVSRICESFQTELQVSLETMMACGIGVCCGCVIKYEEDNTVVYKKACKDGPVFDGSKVVWDG